jgi:hypothetical protein
VNKGDAARRILRSLPPGDSRKMRAFVLETLRIVTNDVRAERIDPDQILIVYRRPVIADDGHKCVLERCTCRVYRYQTSTGERAEMVFLLERAKQIIMRENCDE